MQLDKIQNYIEIAFCDSFNYKPIAEVVRPKKSQYGDFSTNIAMKESGCLRMPPKDIAEKIIEPIRKMFDKVEIVGNGFINFFCKDKEIHLAAQEILEKKDKIAKTDLLRFDKINLEFVSANPTGPLHIGHTRWAAIGDSLARILTHIGAKITTEYYINDHGKQMQNFALSINARLKGKEPPKGGYPGEYIKDIAKQIKNEKPNIGLYPKQKRLKYLQKRGYEIQMQNIKNTLKNFNVHFDIFFNESDLFKLEGIDNSKIKNTLRSLYSKKALYKLGKAVLMTTTKYGDDKDRVLIKSNRETTYFLSDAAYYLEKKRRGYTKLIYFLGADHHGYIKRIEALHKAFYNSYDRMTLDILVGQLISINGSRLSKRKGNILELDDILKEVGSDALRYSLARNSYDTPLNINADDIIKHSADNPVYYVQYAHARSCQISKKASLLNMFPDKDKLSYKSDNPSEKELYLTLGEYRYIVKQSGLEYAPHILARYLERLASAYNKWYGTCKVIPNLDENITDVHISRLSINEAVKIVIKDGLGLLGVSAPARM